MPPDVRVCLHVLGSTRGDGGAVTGQAIVTALPFLAYCLALYLTYRFGRFTMHRDVRSRVLGCEHEIAVIGDQLMRHQKRDAAEASRESRAAKAAVPTGPQALLDDRVPLEQRRDMLRKSFGDAESRAG